MRLTNEPVSSTWSSWLIRSMVWSRRSLRKRLAVFRSLARPRRVSKSERRLIAPLTKKNSSGIKYLTWRQIRWSKRSWRRRCSSPTKTRSRHKLSSNSSKHTTSMWVKSWRPTQIHSLKNKTGSIYDSSTSESWAKYQTFSIVWRPKVSSPSSKRSRRTPWWLAWRS